MSRKKPWFRLYSEIIQDRKLSRCSVEERWCWVIILCLANDSPQRGYLYITNEVPYEMADIANAAALSVEVVEAAMAKFEAVRMLHQEDGIWVVSKFLDRQYEKSSELPENSRKRKQLSRSCHAHVTPHITDKQNTENRVQITENKKQNTENNNRLSTTTEQSTVEKLDQPANQKHINELVTNYCAVKTIKPAQGDYSFISFLYHKYGYEQVLDAVKKLQMVAAVQKLEKPLSYLKAILENATKGGTAREPTGRNIKPDEDAKPKYAVHIPTYSD